MSLIIQIIGVMAGRVGQRQDDLLRFAAEAIQIGGPQREDNKEIGCKGYTEQGGDGRQ